MTNYRMTNGPKKKKAKFAIWFILGLLIGYTLLKIILEI